MLDITKVLSLQLVQKTSSLSSVLQRASPGILKVMKVSCEVKIMRSKEIDCSTGERLHLTAGDGKPAGQPCVQRQ